jgi:hypothetical protein
MNKNTMAATALALGSAFAAPAMAATLYSQDFEHGSAGFKGGDVVGSQGYAAFGDGASLYQVDATPKASSKLTLSFAQASTDTELDLSLAIIDSWDGKGSAYGPDTFTVKVDGTTVFNAVFDNYDGTGATKKQGLKNLAYDQQLGFNGSFADSAYRLKLDLGDLAAGKHVIQFVAHGTGWQGGTDESFGLDNVVVTGNVSAVPEPTGVALLLSGLLMIGTIARRRSSK